MKLLKLLLSLITIVNSYNVINIKTLIKRPIDYSIISFIKINNLDNLNIKNHTNYLIFKFDDKNKNNLLSYNYIYNTIKNNKKPLLIINNKNINNFKSKYVYLIKNKNEYIMKYIFNYNDNIYKYLFNINATKYNNYETLWNILVIINDNKIDDKLNMPGYLIKNWIEYMIYQKDEINDNFKKYLILYFFLNIKKN